MLLLMLPEFCSVQLNFGGNLLLKKYIVKLHFLVTKLWLGLVLGCVDGWVVRGGFAFKKDGWCIEFGLKKIQNL